MVAWSKPLSSQTGREYLEYIMHKKFPKWLTDIPGQMRTALERDFLTQTAKYNVKEYAGTPTLFKREDTLDAPNRIVMIEDDIYEAVWKCHVDPLTGKHRSKAATGREVLSMYSCPGVTRVVDEWWPCCKWCHKRTVDKTSEGDKELMRRSAELSANSPGIAAARVHREEVARVMQVVVAGMPSTSQPTDPRSPTAVAHTVKGGKNGTCKKGNEGNLLSDTIILSSTTGSPSSLPGTLRPYGPAPFVAPHAGGRPATPDSYDSYDYAGSVFAPAPIVAPAPPAVQAPDTPLPLDPFVPLDVRALQATEAWVQSTAQRVTQMRLDGTMSVTPTIRPLPPAAAFRRFWMNDMEARTTSSNGEKYFVYIFDEDTRILFGQAMIDNGIGAYADVIVQHGRYYSLGQSRGQRELMMPPRYDSSMIEDTSMILRVLYDGVSPLLFRALAANLQRHVGDRIEATLRSNVEFNSPPGIQCPENWPRYMPPIMYEYNTHYATRFGVDAFTTTFMLSADIAVAEAVDEPQPVQFMFDVAEQPEGVAQNMEPQGEVAYQVVGVDWDVDLNADIAADFEDIIETSSDEASEEEHGAALSKSPSID